MAFDFFAKFAVMVSGAVMVIVVDAFVELATFPVQFLKVPNTPMWRVRAGCQNYSMLNFTLPELKLKFPSIGAL
jgi:hypothetical protein